MKKLINKENSSWLCLLYCLFIFVIYSCSNKSNHQITGKWLLKEIRSTKTVQSSIDSTINAELSGMVFEFKQDSVLKMELSASLKKTSELTSSPDKYYIAEESGKLFIVQIEKGKKEKFEIAKFNYDTLVYKNEKTIFSLIRI